MASPEMQSVVNAMRRRVQEETAAGVKPSVDGVRAMMQALIDAPPAGPENINIIPASIAGIAGEWLVPDQADLSRRLLYLHGGGYVAGSMASHRPLAAWFAHLTGMPTLLIDYGLAPEQPFPKGVEDALTAYQYLYNFGPDGAAPAGKTYVMGDSAGGGLTLVTLMGIRDSGLPMPSAAATLSAWTDMSCSSDSLKSRADRDPGITPDLVHFVATTYAKDVDVRNWRCSPVFGDYTGLPPLLMHVAEDEVLLDDTLRCAEKAQASGVDVTVERWPGVYHVWHFMCEATPESRTANEQVAAFLRAH